MISRPGRCEMRSTEGYKEYDLYTKVLSVSEYGLIDSYTHTGHTIHLSGLFGVGFFVYVNHLSGRPKSGPIYWLLHSEQVECA